MKKFGQLLRRDIHPFVALLVSSVLLVGMLVFMIVGRAAILRDGVEVIVRTAPVDPRDLMRGDYVQLQYEDISSVDGSLFAGKMPAQEGLAALWLTLVAGDDGVSSVKAISLEKPDGNNAGEVYLKSKPFRWTKSEMDGIANKRLSLQFGIERYYVPEGEGLAIEDARNDRRTTVAIRISAAGEAQIARLMIDGKALYSEPLY
ncbi:MAG: GDYXXLXY domain-containing protein [Hoeflea sp.]|uniref:GDYXXLXY domain-containing protein n=1 Tax=Hoeflea sp. TaxID=1940281 RepID=UPI003EF35EE2